MINFRKITNHFFLLINIFIGFVSNILLRESKILIFQVYFKMLIKKYENNKFIINS